ncbi:MAG TPA: D-2-hydroxyacid dehydrogenase family protein [Solirubrobacteraceae bacterium]|nr:D-2-hydroxyacid dehydrogenase family protein [Solirubrobacteraceae bacterium]
MRIAVLDDYQGRAAQMADWTALGAQVDFLSAPIPHAEIAARLAPYEVLVLMRERTALDAATLAQLSRLRFVVTTGMRNASLDVAHLAARGIPVSGTGAAAGGPAPGVASTVELAWALILAWFKRVPAEDQALRHGAWQTALAENLGGRTLALLGLGNLGRQMLGPARAFGMTPIAWSQNLTAETAAAHGVERVERDELFARADVLSIHLVLSERTRGLVGARELALMAPGAMLVNTSRGPIVDAAALVAALRRGEIAGACLDVYDQEPLPAGDPLREAPNTILLPHLGYATEATLTEMYRQAVEDIAAFISGTPIRLITL